MRNEILILIPRMFLIILLPFWILSAGTRIAAAETKENSVYGPEEIQKDRKASVSPLKISVSASLVTTDVTVMGNNIPKLQAEDFIVYDGNVAQELVFCSYDQLPIALAVLVDRSGSVASILPLLQLSSLLALKNLKPEDQSALFKFCEYWEKAVDLTTDRLSVAGGITKIKSGGNGTQIFKALYKTANYLHEKAPGRRRAIILVSDNCNMGPNLDIDRALDEVLESSITLYNIRIGGMSEKGDMCGESDNNVRRIVEKSGGNQFIAGSEASLQSVLKEVITNLRNQYTLGFYPSYLGEPGSYHKLEIKLRDGERFPPYRVVSRKGYYAGVSSPLPGKTETPATADVSGEHTDQLLVERAILTAGLIRMNIPDIALTVETADTSERAGGPQLSVYLKIDPGGVGFKRIDGQYIGAQDITVFYADSKGKVLEIYWKRLEHRLNPKEYDQFLKEGILFKTTIPQKAAKRILNVVVYDEVRNQIGSKIVELP